MDIRRAGTVTVIAVLLLLISGCETLRENRTACIVTGAVIGGVLDGAADDNDRQEATIIGAGAGALTAYFMCDGTSRKPMMLDRDGDGVADNDDQCPGTPSGVAVNGQGCPFDSDMDGVADYLDRCARTPRGTAVDSAGCALDSDMDGVADATDQCPGTPSGVGVDRQGCPLDSDGDGVADATDRCPGTMRGRAVNAVGCESDDDGDGVVNAVDRCPDTPAGRAVDDRGCHVIFSLKGLNFASNSYELTDAARTQLAEAIDVLTQNPEIRVQIEGHTDNTGREAYNVQLSGFRARAVRDYLVTQGIDAGRLEAKGLGSSMPVATNETADGRAKNRRVDFTLLGQ